MSIEEYDDRERNMELVLPFKCVRSVGGPYDDEAFVAGFAVGRLDGRLEPRTIVAMIDLFYEALVAQVDLVAMSHGYAADVLHVEDGWAHVGFTRSDPELGEQPDD